METFWQTIANYNAATWIYQIIICLAGIALTLLLYIKPTRAVKLMMKIYLIFLYSWIAIVYYMVYCSERSYNYIPAIFWGIIALMWVYDIFTRYTPFERTYKYDKLSLLLYLMPFLYPLFSLARGLEFPMMTSPVMPCSVAVFSIGILLSFSKKVNLLVILFLCHWALIGLSKVYFYKIPEDLLLAGSAIPAIYLFFTKYMDRNLHIERKPQAQIINLLLIIVCVVIGIFFTLAMISEPYQQI